MPLITLGTAATLRPSVRKNAPFGAFPIGRRDPASRTSYARAVVYHYNKQNFGQASNVRGLFSSELLSGPFATSKVVLESEIDSLNIRKSISQPSGTFEMNLFPTQNFKRSICPGDWIILYLFSNQEAFKLASTEEVSPTFLQNGVLVGNVDRIARVVEKDEETDKTTVRYRVSGRNFGKVFEDTDVWFDPYANKATVLDAVLRTAGLPLLPGTPDTLVLSLLQVFLGIGSPIDGGATLPLNQWSIPIQLALAFKGIPKRGKPYFEDILLSAPGITIEPVLPGIKARPMISVDSNGSLWEILQRNCNHVINELFLEELRLPDGSIKPGLILRPRPHNTVFYLGGQNLGAAGPTAIQGKYATMQELALTSYVEISRGEILYENLGKDDHSRVNMIILAYKQINDFIRARSANVNLGPGIVSNPMFIRESIERYGLKRMDQTIEFLYQFIGSVPSYQLLLGFLGQLYDMHFANHMYESGTIECTGVLEAELGKALKINPDKNIPTGSPPKIYYIEGYEHQWRFPNTWRTTFTVTRGQYLPAARLGSEALKVFIDGSPGIPSIGGLNALGDFSQDADDELLAKTVVRKD